MWTARQANGRYLAVVRSFYALQNNAQNEDSTRALTKAILDLFITNSGYFLRMCLSEDILDFLHSFAFSYGRTNFIVRQKYTLWYLRWWPTRFG